MNKPVKTCSVAATVATATLLYNRGTVLLLHFSKVFEEYIWMIEIFFLFLQRQSVKNESLCRESQENQAERASIT